MTPATRFEFSRPAWHTTSGISRLILITMLGLGAFASGASAQRQAGGRPSPSDEGPQVEASSEVSRLMEVAAEAADREDWKLAIDSLQRVIDQPLGLIRRDDDPDIYFSPRALAYDALKNLPAEGADAYRILFNGKAKSLLDRAHADSDWSALREICDRYRFTSHAVEATHLLSSWLLDTGREGEAYRVIRDLLDVQPEAVQVYPQLELKRSVCMALMGDADVAADHLDAAYGLIDRNDNSMNSLLDATGAYVDRLDRSRQSWQFATSGRDWAVVVQM